MQIQANTALVLVDVQRGFEDPRWGEHNNPGAEARIAALLAAWRSQGWPICHVQHDSQSPTGSFRAGTPGHRFKPEAEPIEGEPIYVKKVNSGFIGTTLENDLRRSGIGTLVIVGMTTQHCVSTTTRMAGNLGFEVYLVSDATAAYAQAGWDGKMRAAADIHYAALSDLSGEFATIVQTGQVLEAVRASGHEEVI